MTALKLDVAIVGGGPGGLAAAISLQRAVPGITLKVYERSASVAPRGAGLRLEVNGLKALEAIDPAAYADVQREAYQASGSVMMDAQGAVLRSVEYPSPEDLAAAERWGRRPILVGWWELAEALRRHAPAGVLQTGVEVDSATERPGGGVELRLKGSGQPVHADLLVGCDGYHSRVWEDLLGGKGPDFADTLIWRARLPRERLPKPVERITWVMGGGAVGLVFPVSAGDVVWTVSAQADRLRAAGLEDVLQAHQARDGIKYDSAQRLAHCRAAVGSPGYPREILDLIDATDPATVLEHGAWVRDPATMPDDELGSGCVTVLGDAFHPLRPTGQGTNVTLEDAAVLARCVAEHGICPAALRAYERARLPRIKAIMHQTMAAGRAAYSKGVTMERLVQAPPSFASQEEYSQFLYGAHWPDVATGVAVGHA